MRIYEGSPRQDYEEVLRSIGAFVDQRGLQEILLAEAPDGFILQGIVGQRLDGSAWQDPSMTIDQGDLHVPRRGHRPVPGGCATLAAAPGPANDGSPMAGPYERALRVIGRYIDDQKPKDVFFFEQDGAYVLRLLMSTRQGAKHQLAEFTSRTSNRWSTRAPGCAASRRHCRPSALASLRQRLARRSRPIATTGCGRGPGSTCAFGRACHRQPDTNAPAARPHAEDVPSRRSLMGIIKFIGAVLGLLVAAAVIVPLVVLAGLFIWLKLTEEADEEALELEQEAGI